MGVKSSLFRFVENCEWPAPRVKKNGGVRCQTTMLSTRAKSLGVGNALGKENQLGNLNESISIP